MKVFERVLKLCINKKVVVNYGRCSSGRGVCKCQVEGFLWAFDNLCLVVAVPDGKGGIDRLVVIKKSELESIEIRDKSLILEFLELLSGESGGAWD